MTTAPIEVIEEREQLNLLTGKVLYYTVSSFYEFALLSPPKEDWFGAGGTIATILTTFHLPNNKMTKQLMQRILATINELSLIHKSPTTWMIQTGFDPAARQGRPPVITLNNKGTVAVLHQAVKEQLSIRSATILVNRVLDLKHHPLVSKSAVWGAVSRMGGSISPPRDPIPRLRRCYGALGLCPVRGGSAASNACSFGRLQLRRGGDRVLQEGGTKVPPTRTQQEEQQAAKERRCGGCR